MSSKMFVGSCLVTVFNALEYSAYVLHSVVVSILLGVHFDDRDLGNGFDIRFAQPSATRMHHFEKGEEGSCRRKGVSNANGLCKSDEEVVWGEMKSTDYLVVGSVRNCP